jgi:hypothetical protein
MATAGAKAQKQKLRFSGTGVSPVQETRRHAETQGPVHLSGELLPQHYG